MTANLADIPTEELIRLRKERLNAEKPKNITQLSTPELLRMRENLAREESRKKAEESGIIPKQRERQQVPFTEGQQDMVGPALKLLGRGTAQVPFFPTDMVQGGQQNADRLMKSLFGLDVDRSNLSHLPMSSDVLDPIFGQQSAGESFLTNALTGAEIGGAAGGPLGALAGGIGAPIFQGVSELLEGSEFPEPIKALGQTVLGLIPFIKKAPSTKPSTPKNKIDALKNRINPLEETGASDASGLQAREFQPIETRADVSGIPREVTSEQIPRGSIDPFDYIRENELAAIAPQEITRGDLAAGLSEVNPETERLAKQNTRELYQRAEGIAEGLLFDATGLAEEGLGLLTERRRFKSVDRPAIRRGVRNVLEDLGVNQQLINDINRLIMIDNFMEGEMSFADLPESLQTIAEDPAALQTERLEVQRRIPEAMESGLSDIPVSNLIRAEQSINQIIDFTPRDLRVKAQPERQLNPYRQLIREALDDVGDAHSSFDEAQNAARQSHIDNVNTFGRDFIVKLNKRESGMGVLANDLKNADAANNIAAQLDILRQSPEGQQLIPHFERAVVGEIFNNDNVSFNTERVWQDVRREVSPEARQAGDNLLDAARKSPIEQTADNGMFHQKTLDKMKNIRGLQNARLEIRRAANRMGAPELVDLYEQQFTNQELSKVFDPDSFLINEKKLGALDRDTSLKNSLDEINGRNFSQNFIETQRNILDLSQEMSDLQNNRQLYDRRVSKEAQSKIDLVSQSFEEINNSQLDKPGKFQAFAESWNEIMNKPLTLGHFVFTGLPFLGKTMFTGLKGINLVNAYRQKRAGNPVINRLKKKTNALKRGKIGSASLLQAGNVIDQGIKDMNRDDKEMLDKATQEFIEAAFD